MNENHYWACTSQDYCTAKIIYYDHKIWAKATANSSEEISERIIDKSQNGLHGIRFSPNPNNLYVPLILTNSTPSKSMITITPGNWLHLQYLTTSSIVLKFVKIFRFFYERILWFIYDSLWYLFCSIFPNLWWIFLTPPQISKFWPINWHRCVTIYNLRYPFFFPWVWCPSYGCSSTWPFLADTQIINLLQEGLTILMQCHLGICRGPFYLPKATFKEFVWLMVFS